MGFERVVDPLLGEMWEGSSAESLSCWVGDSADQALLSLRSSCGLGQILAMWSR